MSGPVILEPPARMWECPNCDFKDVTREAKPHARMHNCRGMRGLSVPMVPLGTRCAVVAKEREDYVGKDVVTYDGENRPIMAVETVRDDGNDIAVYAPCASAELKMEV